MAEEAGGDGSGSSSRGGGDDGSGVTEDGSPAGLAAGCTFGTGPSVALRHFFEGGGFSPLHSSSSRGCMAVLSMIPHPLLTR